MFELTSHLSLLAQVTEFPDIWMKELPPKHGAGDTDVVEMLAEGARGWVRGYAGAPCRPGGSFPEIRVHVSTVMTFHGGKDMCVRKCHPCWARGLFIELFVTDLWNQLL